MLSLITRPLAQSIDLQDLLKTKNIDSIIEPMIEIMPIPMDEITNIAQDFIIITSANAIRCFSCLTRERSAKMLVIGRDSAQLANMLGFYNIVHIAQDVDELIKFINNNIKGSMLYLRSDHITKDLKAIIGAEEIIIYKSISAKSLSKEVISHIMAGRINHIWFFSKRSAQIFMSLAKQYQIEKHLNNIIILAISDNVAKILVERSWKKILIARNPSQEAMVELVL